MIKFALYHMKKKRTGQTRKKNPTRLLPYFFFLHIGGTNFFLFLFSIRNGHCTTHSPYFLVEHYAANIRIRNFR